MLKKAKLISVIISGGAGKRLWPLSRETHPKPFIKLNDGQSLLQKAFLRASSIPEVAEVLTVTNQELLFHTQAEYQALDPHIKSSYVLEPEGRNTAPAITAAALYLANYYDEDTVLAIMLADHLIQDEAAFNEAAVKATQLAALGYVVTLGIKPNYAETGYGYIEIKDTPLSLAMTENNNPQLAQASFAYQVRRFIEKPSLSCAEEYVQSGIHFWNSGMFFFRIGTLIQEMKKHAPTLLENLVNCLNLSENKEKLALRYLKLDSASFQKVPEISIDYCLMEKSDRLATVCADFAWSDIGSWNALSNLIHADEKGNRTIGNTALYDVNDCYIHGNERMIGAIGVNHLAIIDTQDALLVINRDRVQDVKHLVEHLKQAGDDTVKAHREVHRPWGRFDVLENGKGFKIKLIHVKPGASLSLQMHHHRSEHWVVVNGTALVINDDQEFLVNTNESTYIPAGKRHRLSNPGPEDLVIVEVQCGSYLGEDDIVRYEDKYERIS